MEGPHGSGGATPETTVSWMWGFAFGAFAIAVAWIVFYLTGSPGWAAGGAALALAVTGIAAGIITDFVS